jgi:hypothetical protein
MTSRRRVPLSIFDRYDAGKPSLSDTTFCFSPARSRASDSAFPRTTISAASFVFVETRSAPPVADFFMRVFCQSTGGIARAPRAGSPALHYSEAAMRSANVARAWLMARTTSLLSSEGWVIVIRS